MNDLRFSSPISSLKQGLGSLFQVALYIAALVGAVQMLAAFTGNEAIPPFRSLQAFRPDLMKIRHEVLTPNITNQDTAEQHWKAFQHTQALLWAINPEIAAWMERLNRENRILWKRHATLFNWPVIASYDWRMNDFYLGPDFWHLPEGEKAAVIAHEYFHYRQNKIWLVGDTILETMSGKLSEYGSRTEDEAHLYQWFAYQAMGMPPGAIVKGYFSQRHLYRFVLSQP